MEDDDGGDPDPMLLMTALTTEHFTLQTARGATISDGAARTSLYLNSVSGALVALAFIAQLSELGEVFFLFALTVLPTLLCLGLLTFARLLECSAEDVHYAYAINRIRHHYKEMAGAKSTLFLLSGHDDDEGAMANMGVRPGRLQPLLATPSSVALVNCVIAGGVVALSSSVVLDTTRVASAVIGAVAGLLAAVLHVGASTRYWRGASLGRDVLFPSPQPAGGRGSDEQSVTRG